MFEIMEEAAGQRARLGQLDTSLRGFQGGFGWLWSDWRELVRA